MEKVSLSFSDGYKSIEINGDPNRVIRINPTDAAFIKRLANIGDKTREIMERYGDIDLSSIEKLKNIDPADPNFDELKAAADNIDKIDRAVRELIDSAFGTPVCDTVFGSAWCISPSGGQPIYMNFLEAMGEYIASEIAKQNEKSVSKLQKYADTAHSFGNRSQRRAAKKRTKKPPKPKAIDISALTDEQRRELMLQLINAET